MEFEQARSMPLTRVFDILKIKPIQQENNEITYRSIFTKDKKGNLIINTDTNRWYDSSTGESGDIIDLVTGYLKSQGENYTVKDALRWLRIMGGYAAEIEPISYDENIPTYAKLSVVESTKIYTETLIQHIESLHFPIQLAKQYLREVRIYDKKERRTERALGFRNEDGGYHAFSPEFSGFIGKQNISFIRGTKSGPEFTHIFKDIFDYMAAVIGFQEGQPFEEDAIILNSYGNLPQVVSFMRGFGCRKAFTWLSNDAVGQEATKVLSGFFKTEPDLVLIEMNN